MAITMTSGPATILASGQVTAFMGHELCLRLDDPIDLVVDFAFESDPTVDDVAVDVTTFANRMRLKCVNFDRADGRGSAQPVLLGEIGATLVFLHFRVFLFGRTDDRTVHYTLYTTTKDDVGWEPMD
jgi:hypothetical protein